MQRFTVSIDDGLAAEFDRLIEARRYSNRSEAFRDMLRHELKRLCLEEASGDCVAVVSYAFNHHTRQLSERMTGHQHSHTSLVVSTMHVHINHDECVETCVMRGRVTEVEKLAAEMLAETGVEHGSVQVIPVESHGEGEGAHEHLVGHAQEHCHHH